MSDERPTPTGTTDRTETLNHSAADPSRFGLYRLLQKLGEGGMGEVWLAEQTAPVRRNVALKIIKQGMDTRQVVARFEAERQALALMDHPAVAKVFDAGATPHGRPYFVMEHVRGVPITEHCDRQRLSTRERLELFVKVCEGVQHAHQKAILHRDLKPSNVLVTTQDGLPVPKIIDFGLAKAMSQKLTERTMFTEVGALVGTPEYMSPEQAEMTEQGVDTRTDVYSLGVMLYQLLVGALPFESRELRAAGFDGIRRKIREEEPPRPSTRLSSLGDRSRESAERRRVDLPTLRRQLRGDLDWVTMRALEKDPARRYGSPNELAADIGRHLRDEPVVARPPSTAYRVGKFIRRHKLGVAAASVLVLGLAAGIVGTTVGMVQARRAQARALDEARKAQRVAGFLEETLGDVNPEGAGHLLRADVRERVTTAVTSRGGGDEEVAAALASLDEALVGVHLTDTGIRLLDEQILDRVAERAETALTEDPEVAARLYRTIGNVRSRLGRSLPAIDAFEQALALRRETLGDDHPDTLQSTLDLAIEYLIAGHDDEHLQMVSDVEERGRRMLGAEHEITLDAMGEVADAYMYGPYDAARVREAEDRHIELLAIERRVLGDDHRQTLYRMDKVAGILSRRGEMQEAEVMYRETLELRRRYLGADDYATIGSWFNLAVYQWRQGRYDEAELVFSEALEIGQRTGGETSMMTMFSMSNLALLCEQQGRYAEAEQWYRGLLEIDRRRLGEEATGTVRWMIRLAGTLTRQGHPSDAEPLLREALRIARRGENAELTARALHELALLHRQQGDLARADETFQRALESARDPDHGAIATYHARAGNVEAAIRAIEALVDGGEPLVWIATDPDFAPLHGTPGFEALVARPPS